MSWRFPRCRELDGYALDAEAINVNFEATVEETQGRLNEHNWSQNFIVDYDDIQPGYCLKATNSYQECDPGMAAGILPPSSTPANGFKVSSNMDWVVVDDLSKTIDVDTSKLWVLASFQQEPSDPATASVRAGMNYGIRIDGVLVWDSVTGGADRSNDVRGEGLWSDWNSGPVVIDVLLPVTAGRHDVEIVAKLPRDEMFNVPPIDDYYMLLNRELIILEAY